MVGATPLYITVGMILEEGFPLDDLRKILLSMSTAAEKAGVRIVGGDTKVVKANETLTFEAPGKTGSAQVVSSAKLDKNIAAIQPHAWFAGFAPFDNPRIVLAVLVDHGGSGGAAAAPVARTIFERFFGITALETAPPRVSPE